MNHILKNDKLAVTIKSYGAEIISAVRDGYEYMWQGDPKYWEDHAPVLFPLCGRFQDNTYTNAGKSYNMGLHGFVHSMEFDVEKVGDNALRFTVNETEETLSIYPFKFRFSLLYTLEGDTLHSEATITNTGSDVLHCTYGGHPGFNVPLEDGKVLTDYYVRFEKPCAAKQQILSPDYFFTNETRPFPADEEGRVHLTHELFDHDGIFMKDVTDTIILECEDAKRYVKVNYPDMPFVGIWKEEKTDAPFLCIEPWCALPPFEDETADFENKERFFHIGAGESKVLRFSITYGEK